jgi:hypothetical protein
MHVVVKEEIKSQAMTKFCTKQRCNMESIIIKKLCLEPVVCRRNFCTVLVSQQKKSYNAVLYDVVKLDVRVSLSAVLATLPPLVSGNSILTFELCAVHLVVTLA